MNGDIAPIAIIISNCLTFIPSNSSLQLICHVSSSLCFIPVSYDAVSLKALLTSESELERRFVVDIRLGPIAHSCSTVGLLEHLRICISVVCITDTMDL